jgi:hypothetical protein
MKEELGFIALYVAVFGFSDYLVEKFNLKGIKSLVYYLIVFLMGISTLYLTNQDE